MRGSEGYESLVGLEKTKSKCKLPSCDKKWLFFIAGAAVATVIDGVAFTAYLFISYGLESQESFGSAVNIYEGTNKLTGNVLNFNTKTIQTLANDIRKFVPLNVTTTGVNATTTDLRNAASNFGVSLVGGANTNAEMNESNQNLIYWFLIAAAATAGFVLFTFATYKLVSAVKNCRNPKPVIPGSAAIMGDTELSSGNGKTRESKAPANVSLSVAANIGSVSSSKNGSGYRRAEDLVRTQESYSIPSAPKL